MLKITLRGCKEGPIVPPTHAEVAKRCTDGSVYSSGTSGTDRLRQNYEVFRNVFKNRTESLKSLPGRNATLSLYKLINTSHISLLYGSTTCLRRANDKYSKSEFSK